MDWTKAMGYAATTLLAVCALGSVICVAILNGVQL